MLRSKVKSSYQQGKKEAVPECTATLRHSVAMSRDHQPGIIGPGWRTNHSMVFVTPKLARERVQRDIPTFISTLLMPLFHAPSDFSGLWHPL